MNEITPREMARYACLIGAFICTMIIWFGNLSWNDKTAVGGIQAGLIIGWVLQFVTRNSK